MTILTICGSLRKGSYNKMLLRAAADAAPAGTTFRAAEIGTLPLFNEDVESVKFPAAVLKLQKAILKADAILIASPEYNRSMTGVLKNALDWISRGKYEEAFADKPVAIMGASSGNIGTAVGQSHLRVTLAHLGAVVMAQPEFHLGRAQDKFSPTGKLTDARTTEFLKTFISAFFVHARRYPQKTR